MTNPQTSSRYATATISDICSPRDRLFRLGNKLKASLNREIVRYSLVPNDPVIPADLFAWTGFFRDQWLAVRNEALALAQDAEKFSPSRVLISSGVRALSNGRNPCAPLFDRGRYIEGDIAHCPKTSELLSRIPRLNQAAFSILEPGSHIPSHRGLTQGLLTCHLGLSVPHGRAHMLIGSEPIHWTEGRAFVFDDTCPHEAFNHTDEALIILRMQFERPLLQPGKQIARCFLSGIHRFATPPPAELMIV